MTADLSTFHLLPAKTASVGVTPRSVPQPIDTPIHDARALLAGVSVARIVLDDQVYTLRLTKSGKLILTK
ncbi:MAG: hemin uptake protein HemP [bacterium]